MVSLSFIIGIIGNVICILLFASPIGTFWQVVKKKSTENYEALPYITTLLCTSLWVFYGFLKNKDGLFIVTVNGVGAVSQLAFVTLFLIYAPKEIKVKALKLVSAMNIGFPGAIIMVTLLPIPEGVRPTFLGTLCASTTIAMFASPLAVKFLVGGVWSFYALLIRDYFLGVPNAIGFLLGSAQLVLYSIYKNKSLSANRLHLRWRKGGSAHLVIKGTMQMPSSMNMVNPK